MIASDEDAPMPQLDFWYEFASTYSYPAAMRIEALAAARGVGLRWRPFLLGPLFAEQGWRDLPFNIYPVKGRYMWRDLARICESLGLKLTRPDPFPQNTLLAARVALALPEGAGPPSAAPSMPPSSGRGGRYRIGRLSPTCSARMRRRCLRSPNRPRTRRR